MRDAAAYRNVVLHRRVAVHLTDGTTFHGILWSQRGPLLELRNAELIQGRNGGVARVPMDGGVVVERSRVSFIQVLPAPDGGA